jgi:Fe-S-cluster containining protein
MYSSVHLEPTDHPDSLTAQGFQLAQHKDKQYFEQPCVAFQPCRCGIYEQRPAICQTYECKLLKRYKAGELSFDKALSFIQEAIQLRDIVRKDVEYFLATEKPQSLPNLFLSMVNKLDKMEADERKQVHPMMQLNVGALRILLSQHFEPRSTELSASTQAN